MGKFGFCVRSIDLAQFGRSEIVLASRFVPHLSIPQRDDA
jgi:hypothetical protein